MHFDLMSQVKRIAKIFKSPLKIFEIIRCGRKFANWFVITSAYVLRRKIPYPYTILTRKGSRIEVADWSEVTTVWRVFCAEEYRLPASCITIVDLGANIGAFTILAAENDPESQVIAVEPFPSTFQRLSDNVQANQLEDRVTLIQSAIHSTEKVVRMTSAESGHSYARRVTKSNVLESIEISGITLTSLLENHQISEVDLLKVDIEGGEYAMLEGCDDETLRKCKVIAMEYHDAKKRHLIWSRLESAGFECVRHLPGNWSGLVEFKRQSI